MAETVNCPKCGRDRLPLPDRSPTFRRAICDLCGGWGHVAPEDAAAYTLEWYGDDDTFTLKDIRKEVATLEAGPRPDHYTVILDPAAAEELKRK